MPVFSSDNPEAANEGATGTRLFSPIMKSFSDFAVPVDNIVDFGSDGCSTI